MSQTFSIGEAKTQLSKLIRLAESGEEIVIRRGPTPVVRLIAAPPATGPKRQAGRMRGEIEMADDFDEWPDDIARALGIID